MSKEILASVSKAVLESTTDLTVDIKPQGRLHALLQKYKIQPKERTFTLAPLTLGTLIAISERLLTIDVSIADIKNEREVRDSLYSAIVSHARPMAEIVALAIQNNRHKLDKALVEFVIHHFTANEMLSVLMLALSKMDIQSFYHTINLARGLNVVESKAANATPAKPAEVSL